MVLLHQRLGAARGQLADDPPVIAPPYQALV
ncbi:hypothetical protein H4W31_006007 [Plantactinospora soyae]|uniref:Uncharacterized protein n=1 Tax=Plantactinospora soyae TaxID=1544732 RepID=A0A927M9L6_9ACTN|nr:hypothetical protein [Plantactinospora soyae]